MREPKPTDENRREDEEETSAASSGARARAWAAENAAALEARRVRIEREGTPLGAWQVWRPEGVCESPDEEMTRK